MWRKIYYVDGQEKHETKKYRKKMVKEYLQNKLCMHQWIHLPATELFDLEKKSSLKIKLSNGHQQYTDPQKLLLESFSH